MKIQILSVLFATIFAVGGHADTVNIAIGANGILGYNDGTDLSATGTSHIGGQGIGQLNDGNLVNPVDNFNGGSPGPYGYAGFTWSTPITDSVTSLNLYLNGFGDGGWFGPNGVNYIDGVLVAPNPSDPTAPYNLAAPVVQVSLDGTDGWTTVATTDNYDAALNGAGAGTLPEATFTLDTPVTGIEGIRVIGLEGGTNSFLGVNELQVEAETPEPSTYVMMVIGAGALIWLARRKLA